MNPSVMHGKCINLTTYSNVESLLSFWSIRMTADQCLEHPWLKQHTKKAEIIEKSTQNECKPNDDIKSQPTIEVEVCEANISLF